MFILKSECVTLLVDISNVTKMPSLGHDCNTSTLNVCTNVMDSFQVQIVADPALGVWFPQILIITPGSNPWIWISAAEGLNSLSDPTGKSQRRRLTSSLFQSQQAA